jgi:hypothetical protein
MEEVILHRRLVDGHFADMEDLLQAMGAKGPQDDGQGSEEGADHDVRFHAVAS